VAAEDRQPLVHDEDRDRRRHPPDPDRQAEEAARLGWRAAGRHLVDRDAAGDEERGAARDMEGVEHADHHPQQHAAQEQRQRQRQAVGEEGGGHAAERDDRPHREAEPASHHQERDGRVADHQGRDLAQDVGDADEGREAVGRQRTSWAMMPGAIRLIADSCTAALSERAMRSIAPGAVARVHRTSAGKGMMG
jgi:hypothetical protein